MAHNKKWLAFFSVLAAVILTVVGVLSYQKTHDLAEVNLQVTQSNEVLTEVSAVRGAMEGAQNRADDFAITGEERFRNPYFADVANAQHALDRLRILTAHELGQTARLDDLDPLVEDAFQVFHDAMNPYPGSVPTPQESARRRMHEQRSMEGIRRILQALEDEEHRLLIRRNAIAAQESQEVKNTVILGGLLALGSLLAGCILLFVDVREAPRAAANR